jgi:copper chaperone CopZ
VQGALEGVGGVESASVDLDSGKATIKLDASKVTADDLIKAVAEKNSRYKAKVSQ